MSVTLSMVDQPPVKVTSLLRHLAPVSRAEMQLLRSVSCLETRCRLVMDKSLAVRTGDHVSYLPPLERNCPVRAVVRYIGPVLELSREGHLLGLEVTEPGWAQGTLGKHYFNCPPGRAVFCNIGDVSSADNSSHNNNRWTNKMNNLSLSDSRNSDPAGGNNLRRIHNDFKNRKVRKHSCAARCLSAAA